MELPRHRKQGGFTLLEVVVAFTIFAVTFAAVVQILSASSRNEQIAADYGLAVSYAESLLALTGVETPLRVGTTTGDADHGMRWERSVRRYGDTRSSDPSSVVPYSIKITVILDAGEAARSVTLTTLRLGAPG